MTSAIAIRARQYISTRRIPASRLLSFMVIATLLGGCASGYQMPVDASNYQHSLDASRAFRDVQQYLESTDNQAGLCSASTNDPFSQPAKLLTVKDPFLIFESSFEVRGELFKGVFKMNLRDLVRIRVLDDRSATGCPVYSPKGYMLMVDDRGVGNLSEGRVHYAIIHVSTQNLDRLVAALSYLSPNAKLMRGVGL